MKNIILFSGGIDSTTALYWAVNHNEKNFALTIDYGQKHIIEIDASKKITNNLSVPQKIIQIDLSQIGGSSLTDHKMNIPKIKKLKEIGNDTPNTYVPFRNGIFLSLGAAWAEIIQADSIITGFNVIDSPQYPDTTELFANTMEEAINLGTKTKQSGNSLKVSAPFIHNTKSEIIKKGLSLGADYSYSISCYSGSEIPCQQCSSCLLRQKAWEEAGEKDHLLQRLKKERRL